MHSSKPDRRLRQALTDLAALSDADRAAIVQRLTPGNRPAIESLLHEFARRPLKGTAVDFGNAGLSPWMIEMLEKAARAKADALHGKSFALLRSCAQDLLPSDETALAFATPSLLSRLASAFAHWRGAR